MPPLQMTSRQGAQLQGYLLSLHGGAMDWSSQRQKTVITSTTEAGLIQKETPHPTTKLRYVDIHSQWLRLEHGNDGFIVSWI
jgi:hypothetical protein